MSFICFLIQEQEDLSESSVAGQECTGMQRTQAEGLYMQITN